VVVPHPVQEVDHRKPLIALKIGGRQKQTVVGFPSQGRGLELDKLDPTTAGQGVIDGIIETTGRPSPLARDPR